MALFRIYQVVHQFDVMQSAFEGNAVVSEDIVLIFKVISIFIHILVLEDFPKLDRIAFCNPGRIFVA